MKATSHHSAIEVWIIIFLLEVFSLFHLGKMNSSYCVVFAFPEMGAIEMISSKLLNKAKKTADPTTKPTHVAHNHNSSISIFHVREDPIQLNHLLCINCCGTKAHMRWTRRIGLHKKTTSFHSTPICQLCTHYRTKTLRFLQNMTMVETDKKFKERAKMEGEERRGKKKPRDNTCKLIYETVIFYVNQ